MADNPTGRMLIDFEAAPPFGMMALLDGPSLNDMIVVLTWDSPGPLVPVEVMLRHQLYQHHIEQLLDDHEEIWVMPCNSKHRQKVARRLTPTDEVEK